MAYKQFTQSEFIAKARQVHGNKYDYDKVVYTGCNDKVIITCREHGDFTQKPFLHNIGQGCNQCGYESTKGHRNEARLVALSNGDKTYTGTKCKRGHTLRYSKNNACVECVAMQRKEWVAKNKTRYKELCKHKDALRCERSKDAKRCLNSDMKAQVKSIYAYARLLTAKYGKTMTVDHIIPLQGDNVCGLHVPHNMQIVSKSYNSSKNNRLAKAPEQVKPMDCIMIHSSAMPWNQKEITNEH